jgi:hypothetical protein
VRALKSVVVLALLGSVALGVAGCDKDTASSPPASSQPTGELGDIQSTFDNIDADIAGDDSP